MPSGALLDPGNRLLGGATGDFSLYGALPVVTIGTATPTPADPSLLTIASPAPAPPSSDLAQAPHIIAPVEQVGTAPVLGSGIADSDVGSLLQSTQPPGVAAPSPTSAPQVVSPVGSGSTAPIVADTTLPLVARGDAASGSGDAAPLTQGLAASSLGAPILSLADAPQLQAVAALAPAILALATPALDGVGETAGGVVTSVGATLDGTVGLLDGVTDGTSLPLVDTTVGAVGGTLSDTAATVDLVGDTATTAAGDTATVAVGDTTAQVADTATQAVDGTVTALGDTAATATDTLAGAGTTAADLAAPLADDQLAGTDPAGGVTTLVSMVESAAMFEVGQPSEQPDAATASTSIIDSLAADEAPAALLGDAAHGVDDLLPHHDDGVPGLS